MSLGRFVVLVAAAALAALQGSATPSAAAWSPQGLQVAPADSIQSDPVIAPDDHGGAFIAWQDYRSGYSLIFAQHLTAEGVPASGWPVEGLQVSTGAAYDPFIVADAKGGAFISATDGRYADLWHVLPTYGPTTVSSVAVPVPVDGSAFIGARHSEPADVAKTSPTVLSVLTADGAGGVFLVFELGGHLTEYPYAMHFNADGTVSWSRELGYGDAPVSCSDGAAGLIVFWNAWVATHISVLPDTVVTDWGSWVSVSTSTGNRNAPGMVADGAGGAIVVWQDRKTGDAVEHTYAQHVTALGGVAPGWSDSGLVVCSYPTEAGLTRYSRWQQYSSVTSDGAGGALIAWRDMRADSGDVYVQRLTPGGSPAAGWPVNGLPLCIAGGIQMAPSIASDGAGGAFVSWQDHRSGTGWQVFVQHVQASGTLAPGWPLNGLAACVAPGDHLIPRPAPDGAGGAVVAWQDTRASLPAIFASRIEPDGSAQSQDPCQVSVTHVATAADSGKIDIVWHLTSQVTASVLCRQVDGPWVTVGMVNADANGNVEYADEGAIAGCRYGYALAIPQCASQATVIGEVWIDVPEGAGFAPLSARARAPIFHWGSLDVSWRVAGGEGLSGTLLRGDSCSTWSAVGTAAVDDSGVVHFADQHLYEGHTLGYRLMVHACGRDTSLAEQWISIPQDHGFIRTLAMLKSAVADDAGAQLVWQMLAGPPCAAHVYRRDIASAWEFRGAASIDANGTITFHEAGLTPGTSYEYCLGLSSCQVERLFGLVTVNAPTFTLALQGAWPNPARDRLSVAFTLEKDEPAILELFDMGGRLVSSRAVGGVGPGHHTFDLSDAGLRSGIYVIRLTEGNRTRTARAVVLR